MVLPLLKLTFIRTLQLERLRLDAHYLRGRAHMLKTQRPQLSFAVALSTGYSAAQG